MMNELRESDADSHSRRTRQLSVVKFALPMFLCAGLALRARPETPASRQENFMSLRLIHISTDFICVVWVGVCILSATW